MCCIVRRKHPLQQVVGQVRELRVLESNASYNDEEHTLTALPIFMADVACVARDRTFTGKDASSLQSRCKVRSVQVA